jgi:hypothetical protein
MYTAHLCWLESHTREDAISGSVGTWTLFHLRLVVRKGVPTVNSLQGAVQGLLRAPEPSFLSDVSDLYTNHSLPLQVGSTDTIRRTTLRILHYKLVVIDLIRACHYPGRRGPRQDYSYLAVPVTPASRYQMAVSTSNVIFGEQTIPASRAL